MISLSNGVPQPSPRGEPVRRSMPSNGLIRNRLQRFEPPNPRVLACLFHMQFVLNYVAARGRTDWVLPIRKVVVSDTKTSRRDCFQDRTASFTTETPPV